MNNQFDELTKSLAQSTTRRGAFKKFGVGLAGMALAFFGLASKAQARGNKRCWKDCMKVCVADLVAQGWSEERATYQCQGICSLKCFGF